MNLKFDLNNRKYTTTVQVDGKSPNIVGNKLFIDGIDDQSVLAQLWDQYGNDGEMKDVASATLLTLRLRGGAFSDISAGQFLGHMVAIADALLSSNDVVEPKVRADLEKIKSIGSVEQTAA